MIDVESSVVIDRPLRGREEPYPRDRGEPRQVAHATATYSFEQTETGTRVQRRCQIRVTGIMRLMEPEPLMRIAIRKKKDEMLVRLRAFLDGGPS